MKNYYWTYDIYNHKSVDIKYSHTCIGNKWSKCIPFEGNKHLVSTYEKV